MALRFSQTIPAAVLLILAVIGILLMVIPCKDVLVPPENMYGIVLDAGSSHTSMYIYKWPADKQNGTGIVSEHDECHAEGGGISSYAGVPGGAAKSLEACLEKAVKIIPKARHSQTPLCLGATAGMRLLDLVNSTESQQVLREVKRKLQSYPFNFKEAVILSGQDEGAYGWVTVNYLLGNFVKYGFVGKWLNPGKTTIGALDLGGASTQITFETSEKIEDPHNAKALRLYGQNHTLYTQSFLCYGQDQFLRKLLALLIKNAGITSQVSHPCYPRQFNMTIKLGEDVFDSPCTKEYKPPKFDRNKVVTVVGTGDYQTCLDSVKEMFSFDNCSFSRCSFNGVFQPKVTGNFMAFSAFFFSHSYLTRLTNITITSPHNMKKATRLVCNMTISEMMAKTKQAAKYMKNVCAVSHFVQVLLMEGYHFDEASFPSISFQKKAEGASVGWALGYMLNISNTVPTESLALGKALTPGAFTGVLIIFIILIFITIGYCLWTYKKSKSQDL
ncbi:ectonucleoside triphosphate diphosphohydrolase 2-like [Mugil cephalus]|uniref:ectonucleoside triphosphate diphosphohydrolase 2-like n=1 Tax=Mugil cephalus TaxID=48193 RepID=UPI001FB81B6C|nr:ectonucleoside triphosphate diphosphohydrolase 2-like [Mugil cephalus]